MRSFQWIFRNPLWFTSHTSLVFAHYFNPFSNVHLILFYSLWPILGSTFYSTTFLFFATDQLKIKKSLATKPNINSLIQLKVLLLSFWPLWINLFRNSLWFHGMHSFMQTWTLKSWQCVCCVHMFQCRFVLWMRFAIKWYRCISTICGFFPRWKYRADRVILHFAQSKVHSKSSHLQNKKKLQLGILAFNIRWHDEKRTWTAMCHLEILKTL